MNVAYLHLPAGREAPPVEDAEPYRAVVVLDQATSDEWQGLVSDWLVGSGCLYMIAWGPNSSSWDDSVDHANLVKFDFGEIPDDSFVMTTWHDAEPLSETFWFAANTAHHPTIALDRTLIVDVTPTPREAEMLAAYIEAQQT